MATEISICRALLDIIAAVMERVSDLQRKLGSSQLVEITRSGLDIRKYSGAAVQVYVEADVREDRNICWWLEFSVRSDDTWLIESSIYESHGEILHRFADVAAEDLEDLAEVVQGAADNLLASIDIIPGVRRVVHGEH